MALKEHGLKFVVDILCGVVLVGDNLVKHNSALSLNLILRENGVRGKFKKKADSLREILPQDCCVKHYLLLGGEGVQLPAKAVEV